MLEEDKMVLYVGVYDSKEAAEKDYKNLKELHHEGWVGSYDVGVVAKDKEGKLDMNWHTGATAEGAWTGAAIGALVGLIFPPSMLATSLVGAGTGAAIGYGFNDISAEDLEEIGEYLSEGEAALVVIGEPKAEEMVKKATKEALKSYKKEVNVDTIKLNQKLDKEIRKL